MTEIQPNDPSLLTDEDVDYSFFSCCGDEDLIFLRCPHCHHVWVECFECSTWFVDLTDLDLRQSSFVTSETQRLACPHCENRFEDQFYLSKENCHAYLATRRQVVNAGFTKFLSKRQRELAAKEVSDTVAGAFPYHPIDPRRKWMVVGSAIGAAGWLLGVGFKLITLGLPVDASVPLLAAVIIILIGYGFWFLRCQGNQFNFYTIIQVLLGASALLGFIAIFFLRARGTLEMTIDPQGIAPEWVNFLAPMIIFAMMAIFCIPAINDRFSREYL